MSYYINTTAGWVDFDDNGVRFTRDLTRACPFDTIDEARGAAATYKLSAAHVMQCAYKAPFQSHGLPVSKATPAMPAINKGESQ